MRHSVTHQHQQEPIGIVIADGGYGDPSPRFSAFVWGPVPEDLDDIRVHDQVRNFVAAA